MRDFSRSFCSCMILICFLIFSAIISCSSAFFFDCLTVMVSFFFISFSVFFSSLCLNIFVTCRFHFPLMCQYNQKVYVCFWCLMTDIRLWVLLQGGKTGCVLIWGIAVGGNSLVWGVYKNLWCLFFFFCRFAPWHKKGTVKTVPLFFGFINFWVISSTK